MKIKRLLSYGDVSFLYLVCNSHGFIFYGDRPLSYVKEPFIPSWKEINKL